MAQLDAPATVNQEVAGKIPTGSGSILSSIMEIDHEIFSMIILFLPLIQEWHLSVSSKRMCTSTG